MPLRKDPAYEWANFLVGSIYAIDRSCGGCVVDLQTDRLLFLSLGDAGLRFDHCSESFCRGIAVGRMGYLYPDGICFPRSHRALVECARAQHSSLAAQGLRDTQPG